jgi:uncharacterized transporter YbjL
MTLAAWGRTFFFEGGIMHNYDFGSTTGPQAFNRPGGDEPPRHSVLSLVLLIVAVGIVAAVGLGLVFWAFGFLFHVASLLLKVALIVAVAALVWKRITRGRSRKYDY